MLIRRCRWFRRFLSGRLVRPSDLIVAVRGVQADGAIWCILSELRGGAALPLALAGSVPMPG